MQEWLMVHRWLCTDDHGRSRTSTDNRGGSPVSMSVRVGPCPSVCPCSPSHILAAPMKSAAPRSDPPAFASTLGEVFAWALVIVSPFLVVAGKESFRLPKLLVGEWLGLASVLCLAWSLRGAGLRDAWRLPAV